jgi:hypothetical protein
LPLTAAAAAVRGKGARAKVRVKVRAKVRARTGARGQAKTEGVESGRPPTRCSDAGHRCSRSSDGFI